MVIIFFAVTPLVILRYQLFNLLGVLYVRSVTFVFSLLFNSTSTSTVFTSGDFSTFGGFACLCCRHCCCVTTAVVVALHNVNLKCSRIVTDIYAASYECTAAPYAFIYCRFVNLRFTVEDGASLVFDMPKTQFGPNSGVSLSTINNK